ncbi:fungal-specific transcription factor domain-containing protein [Mycena galopus ATCC 62051]|nr:fungal-specific transcription factor domain-containing protein [Mycena galopus ATCC 62051]
MSDEEEDYSGFGFTRQRRTLRSCDFCRQRKIRCQKPNTTVPEDNDPYSGDGCCSSCLKFGIPCVYTHPVGKRGPKNRLVEELRRENATLKAQLRSLSLCRLCSQPLAHEDGLVRTVFTHSSPESDTGSSAFTEPPDENEQDFAGDELAARFSQFSLESMKTSYFGSAFAPDHNNPSNEKLDARPVVTRTRRPCYWEMSPWEKEAYAIRTPRYVYPPADLITSLLELYFRNFHPTTPLLHRPSFERSVAEGLHLKDMAFGGLLLSVLGLASRYTNDPRVLIDGNPLSAGWKFITQVRTLRRLFEPTIYEVQIYCLMSYYALGGSVPQVAWMYIGLGIRFLQQRGEYRRKPKGHRSGPEDELWKRAFWSFAVLERMVCLILGHPMCLHVENYNVEMPLEVDDEYWDRDFIQPPGKPSQLTYFVYHLRLCEIVGDATRRLYGSKKSKMLLGWDGPQWEQRTVADLDTAMDEFMNSVPPHLRWDARNPPQGTFFDQSATLHLTYNYARIAIHRPFIHKATLQLATASLSICTSAARAVLHIADAWLSKLQRIPLPSLINPVFISGIILVLNMIATKRAGLSTDNIRDDLMLVETAMEILKYAEYRLKTVGRQRDLLGELRSLDGPVPQNNGVSSVAAPASSPDVQDSFYSQLAPSPGYPESVDAVQPALSTNLPDAFYSQQLQVPAIARYTNDNGAHKRVAPGSLLADPKLHTINGVLDDELLSVWMTAPSDVANLRHWDAYLQNRNVHNGADASWVGDPFGS